MAVHAVVAQCTSVQFIDSFASGFLMKTVDVLSDYCLEFSGIFEFCKFVMSWIRFYSKGEEFCPVESVKLFWIFEKECVAYNLFRRIFPLLIIKSVSASEIRNS